MNVIETAIIRRIEAEGNWLVDPKCTTYDEQQAILRLRKAGIIEQAAYGGLRMKRRWQMENNHTNITARFAALGIHSTRPIVECRDAMRRPGPQPSWAILLAPGDRIPAAAWEHIESASSQGNYFVVQLKGVE